MYKRTIWQDHVEGVQDGTDLNAANFNKLEAGTMEANALAAMNAAFHRYGMANVVGFGSYKGKGAIGEEQVIDLGFVADAVFVFSQDVDMASATSGDVARGFDIKGGWATASSPIERNGVKLVEIKGAALHVKGWVHSDGITVNFNEDGKTYNYIAIGGGGMI